MKTGEDCYLVIHIVKCHSRMWFLSRHHLHLGRYSIQIRWGMGGYW